jgi:hypothetical protein
MSPAPFLRDEEGELVAGEAVECQSRPDALGRASSLARTAGNVGAIAFSRSGGLELGDFDPAEVLARHGEVPDDLS